MKLCEICCFTFYKFFMDLLIDKCDFKAAVISTFECMCVCLCVWPWFLCIAYWHHCYITILWVCEFVCTDSTIVHIIIIIMIITITYKLSLYIYIKIMKKLDHNVPCVCGKYKNIVQWISQLFYLFFHSCYFLFHVLENN